MNKRSTMLIMLVSLISCLVVSTCLQPTSAEKNVTLPLSFEDRQNESSVNTSYDQELSDFIQRLELLINMSSIDSRDSTLELELTRSRVPDGIITSLPTNNTSLDYRDMLELIEKLNQENNSSSNDATNNSSSNDATNNSSSNDATNNSSSNDATNNSSSNDATNNSSSNDATNNNPLLVNLSLNMETTSHSQLDNNTVWTQKTRGPKQFLDNSQVTFSYILGETDQTYVIVVIVSVSAVVVLVIVVITTCMWYKRCRQSSHKQMMLNKDFNRWDPQLLRPSQKSIDAFIFGTPIPSVTEMIKV